MKKIVSFLSLAFLLSQCNSSEKEVLSVQIFQSDASGNKLKEITEYAGETASSITLDTSESFQTISGFGGSFTESTAYLLNQLSDDKRSEILDAYFSNEGAQYSLTRTHMNSSDFSLDHYSYTPIAGDTNLINFSIEEDRDDIIPMILDAQKISEEGFKIVASPWTAPPWMKDNNDWYGGKLLKEYYPAWARFFSKYANAYAAEGINIWAFTFVNEPLGNGSHWESMHFSPEECADFVKNHLGPQLKKDSLDIHILVYDQNRGVDLEKWSSVLLNDKELLPYIYGTAVHWYSSTFRYFPESLQYTHNLAPDKHIINTEACIDNDIPRWRDDAWYWKKEATDWGWQWALEENKPNHPQYVPVYRYARDIIGCLNNWVEGWIDWNMVLDIHGGPNLAQNWCIAPVIVDVDKNEVYYTPLYYTLSHFSKFIRPGAKRIAFENSDDSLMTTALINPDGSVVLIVLNMTEEEKSFEVKLGAQSAKIKIDKQALQTIVFNKNTIERKN